MNATQILAHPDQSLVKHLLGVARRAKEFAARFQGENHAELAGLLHDLGKAEKGSQANVLKRKAWRFGQNALASDGAAESLIKMLDVAITKRVGAAHEKKASTTVMDVRAQVLAACKGKAAADRGVFTLAVPTGGGKTLASIAFALHHIAHHNKKLAEDGPRRLRRIIVAPMIDETETDPGKRNEQRRDLNA